MSVCDVGALHSDDVQSLREPRKQLSKQIAAVKAAGAGMRHKSRRHGNFGITQYQERLVSTIYYMYFLTVPLALQRTSCCSFVPVSKCLTALRRLSAWQRTFTSVCLGISQHMFGTLRMRL